MLSDEGAAFAWGWNKFCQLGLEKATAKECVPCEIITQDARVKDLSCGWWHTLFLVDLLEA